MAVHLLGHLPAAASPAEIQAFEDTFGKENIEARNLCGKVIASERRLSLDAILTVKKNTTLDHEQDSMFRSEAGAVSSILKNFISQFQASDEKHRAELANLRCKVEDLENFKSKVEGEAILYHDRGITRLVAAYDCLDTTLVETDHLLKLVLRVLVERGEGQEKEAGEGSDNSSYLQAVQDAILSNEETLAQAYVSWKCQPPPYHGSTSLQAEDLKLLFWKAESLEDVSYLACRRWLKKHKVEGLQKKYKGPDSHPFLAALLKTAETALSLLLDAGTSAVSAMLVQYAEELKGSRNKSVHGMDIWKNAKVSKNQSVKTEGLEVVWQSYGSLHYREFCELNFQLMMRRADDLEVNIDRLPTLAGIKEGFLLWLKSFYSSEPLYVKQMQGTAWLVISEQGQGQGSLGEALMDLYIHV
ncbi:hypothetical protein GOP47_0019997 [Adiantum capillus-veneris]|uniref:Uncharacterized protein n=1 Tax=Adiantum capillus-veneris TaxID=13818 RepID=A0A9D4Z949_ADICA|nr:hypothetical protein GOP47_0019997 [Adiantum capillus-veneris]